MHTQSCQPTQGHAARSRLVKFTKISWNTNSNQKSGPLGLRGPSAQCERPRHTSLVHSSHAHSDCGLHLYSAESGQELWLCPLHTLLVISKPWLYISMQKGSPLSLYLFSCQEETDPTQCHLGMPQQLYTWGNFFLHTWPHLGQLNAFWRFTHVLSTNLTLHLKFLRHGQLKSQESEIHGWPWDFIMNKQAYAHILVSEGRKQNRTKPSKQHEVETGMTDTLLKMYIFWQTFPWSWIMVFCLYLATIIFQAVISKCFTYIHQALP